MIDTCIRSQLERYNAIASLRNTLSCTNGLADNCGAGVRIALLDSGLQFSNPVFAQSDIRGIDFTGTGDLNDSSGHGTANAALLVGRTGDAVGLTPESELLVAKVSALGDRKRSAHAIIAALHWAVREQANIIILPFGSSHGVAGITQAIRKAVTAGVEIFAAAGNRGPEQICYPAWLPEVNAVSAVTRSGGVLKGCCATSEVDIYCWGEAVPSLSGGHSYQISGSSPATVLAGGIRALQLAQARTGSHLSSAKTASQPSSWPTSG